MKLAKDFVKKARDELQIDREEFARRLGVTQRTVYRWEIGEVAPKKRDMLAIQFLLDSLQEVATNRKRGIA